MNLYPKKVLGPDDPPPNSGGQPPPTPPPDNEPSWQKLYEASQEPPPTPPPPSTPPEPPTPPPPTPPPDTGSKVVQMDEEGLRRLLAGVVGATRPEQPSMSEEELEKMFNVYKATEETLTSLGIEPTPDRVLAINGMLQGVAKQSATISHVQLQYAIKQIQDQLAPVMSVAEQYHQEQLQKKFFKKYPHLEGFEPMLMKVRDSLIQSGKAKDFKSEEEAFKTVAEETEALLKIAGVDPKTASPKGRAAAGTSATTKAPPPVSGGGQGGAGDVPPQPPQENWRKIFR